MNARELESEIRSIDESIEQVATLIQGVVRQLDEQCEHRLQHLGKDEYEVLALKDQRQEALKAAYQKDRGRLWQRHDQALIAWYEARGTEAGEAYSRIVSERLTPLRLERDGILERLRHLAAPSLRRGPVEDSSEERRRLEARLGVLKVDLPLVSREVSLAGAEVQRCEQELLEAKRDRVLLGNSHGPAREEKVRAGLRPI